MADLSDADKKALLGPDYRQAESTRDAQRGITDETRLANSRQEMKTSAVAGATGVGIVAFLIGLANYTSHGTPYNSTLVMGCIVVVLASAATVAWFKYK